MSNSFVTLNPSKTIIKLVADASRKLSYKREATKVVRKKTHKTKKSTAIKTRTKAKQGTTAKESELPIVPPLQNEQTEPDQEIIFPQITASNWNKFEDTLSKKEIDQVTKKLDVCLARMHGYQVYDTHFTSLHFVRLAIVDCLLHRKWDNLLKLVVTLSRNYSDPVFTMFIRHLCQILKQYHPAIRGTEFEDQIDLIVEKYDREKQK